MKWIKRCIWIAAWSAWLWLGVGLYRELPRDLGPPICKVALKPKEQPLGFVPGTTTFATLHPFRDGKPATISVYDGLTGQLTRTIPGPHATEFFACKSEGFRHCEDALRHGLALTNRGPSTADDASGLHWLDIAAGRWERISDNDAVWAEMHPKHRWVLFCERFAPGYSERRIVVYDLDQRRELFAMISPTLGKHVVYACFQPETDRLVLGLRPEKTAYKRGEPGIIAVWSLASSPTLVRTVDPAFVGETRPACSACGRVAFGEPMVNDPVVDVVDLADGSLMARFPGWNVNDGSLEPFASPPCTISHDGRTVLGGKPATLWNVDSKRQLWQGKPYQAIFPDASRNEFVVLDNWSRRLPSFLRFGWMHDYSTMGWRSLATGQTLRRTWASQWLPTNLISSDGTLGVTLGGAVHRTTPCVNWLLLALCQSVVALPLVLLWAMLWWRRRRRQSAAG